MTVKNQVIGHATCPDCQAKVELRINVNRKVYWHCDGKADDRQCNAMSKHGAAKSRRLIADAAKVKTANDNKTEKENPNHDETANDNTGTSERQSAGDGTKTLGGFGLFSG